MTQFLFPLEQLYEFNLERFRIQALMKPIVYYIQDQLEEIGFRNLKKQINLLIKLIATPESIELSIKHNIHLLDILYFLKEARIEGLPEIFITEELSREIKRIESKIEVTQLNEKQLPNF